MPIDVFGRSIAIWAHCIPEGRNGAINVQLHFNLWRLPHLEGASEDELLDIGIFLPEREGLESLHFYFPKELQRSAITDLGRKLGERSIAVAIFNDEVTVKSDSRRIEIEHPGRAEKKNVYQLTVDSEIEIQCPGDGSVLTLSKEVIGRLPLDHIYIRFRVLLGEVSNSPFALQSGQIDRYLVSGYNESEIVDFRVNEFRNIPEAIRKEIARDRAEGWLAIEQLHFFFVRDKRWGFVHAYQDFYKCRILEADTWSGYIDSHRHALNSHLVIYHWRHDRRPSTKSYNCFAKFGRHVTSWGHIGIFVVGVLLLGAIGNLLSALIFEDLARSWLTPLIHTICCVHAPLQV